MKQVGAVGLEVEAFASGVGGEQNAEGIFTWISIETALNLFPPGTTGQAIDNLDPVLGIISAFNSLFNDSFQPAFCALAIFGED